jgi:branched-chain amino acid transport system permease protein
VVQPQLLDMMIPKECGAVPMDAATRNSGFQASPPESDRAIIPRPDLLPRPARRGGGQRGRLELEGVALSFGGVHAIEDLDLEIRAGQVHGLIGPNGSGKTTTLNVICGYYGQQRRAVRHGVARVQPPGARVRIARTFQTPRIVRSASVLENVKIGATIDGQGTFLETL